jgi:exosortase
MTAQPGRTPKISASTAIFLSLLALAILWSYWTTLGLMVARWSEDPQYSHGWLVPVFAGYLLWLRRDRLIGQNLSVNLLGLGLLAAALVLRLGGTYYHFDYLDQVSLLPCLAGIFMLVGSWPALFWAMPAVAFLAFMVPLPHTLSVSMSGPMQAFATTLSTFFLQVLGRPALAEGNVILLNDIELGIVEACSGLRMLVVFFALSTAVSMIIRKPLWEKVLIASSAIPIALASNVLRITVTGLFYDSFGNHFGGAFFHDLAGWLMMPLGLCFLGLELWVLSRLLLERSRSLPLPSQLSLQRVEINAVAMYRGASSSRREKSPSTPLSVPVPAPEPEQPAAAEALIDTAEPVPQRS